jgi:hypothetical protein
MGTDLEQYITDKELIKFKIIDKGTIVSVFLRITDAFNVFLKFVDDYNNKYMDNQNSSLLDSHYFIQANGLENLYVF